MILYNSAFDLYHTIFRMLHLLSKVEPEKALELERVRIWDFYLLFPTQIFNIKPKRHEKDFKQLLKLLNIKSENPYQLVSNNRLTLEKIKPYQILALNCIASYGLIEKDNLKHDQIVVKSKELLGEYINSVGKLSDREKNIISIVTSSFYEISLFGRDGLKNRTDLIESKYDAK